MNDPPPADYEPAQTVKHEAALSRVPQDDVLADRSFDLHVEGQATNAFVQSLPDRVGDYELLEEIARGGMGVVFKARHIGLQRLVALKMILNGPAAGTDGLERFHLEAAATAQLQHPHIVAVYDVGSQGGQPFFSMEYVDGSSLARRLEGGPLPGSVAARYLETTARAVHYAHTRGILHRDLKPANILLDDQDQPKVTDFGLAKVLQSDLGQTRTGTVMGTPSYMSPEQATGQKDLGAGCDVYSLGAILYELLTGRPPFQAESALATLLAVAEQEPVPPRLLNPKVDRDLETICLKCLEKSPARRYPSAEALAEDLHRYLQGEPITARRLGRVGRAWKWCRRNPAAAALLALSVLTLLAGVGAVLAFGVYQHRVAGQEYDLRQRAEQAAQLAAVREEIARRMLYVAQFHLAHHAWESGNVEHAEELLATWLPQGNKADLRGWEWYYLRRLCRGQASVRDHAGRATALAFQPRSLVLAMASDDRTIKLWNLAAADAPVRMLSGLGAPVEAIAFSPDGKRLAAACRDQSLRIYNAADGKEECVLRGHTAAVRAVAYRGDGKLLASAGDDHTVRLWDPATGQQMGTLKGHTSPVVAVVFSPDGTRLASASHDHTIRLWDQTTRRELTVLRGHGGEVAAVAFSPDGGRLASASFDRTVRLWDPSSGREVGTLKGHSGGVNGVVFSPDGRRLASAGADHTVRIWDTVTGQEVLMLDAGSGPAMCVVFSPDGRHLASAGSERVVRLWSAGGE